MTASVRLAGKIAHRGRQASASLFGVLALTGIVVPAALVPADAKAAMDVRIANTEGQGVSSRYAPRLAARNGYGAPERAVVTIQCHEWGEAVGSRSNRLWDYVTYQGRAFYVPDLYTDSPTTANKPINGMPFCGQQSPPPPPPAGDATANSVANWASGHVGQVYASSADRQLLARYGSDSGWAPGPVGEWSGDCMRFAAAAWYSVDKVPTRGTTAKAVADAYARAGRLRRGTPPRGTLVFYDWGDYGHVGISLGNGQVVSTQGADKDERPNRQHALNGIGLTYRGYVDPR